MLTLMSVAIACVMKCNLTYVSDLGVCVDCQKIIECLGLDVVTNSQIRFDLLHSFNHEGRLIKRYSWT
jgi:anthranilate/para-aminobenzoate synthase component II